MAQTRKQQREDAALAKQSNHVDGAKLRNDLDAIIASIDDALADPDFDIRTSHRK